MVQQVERKKQGDLLIAQEKLVQSLKKLTLNMITLLDQDQLIDNFTLDQRDSLIESIKLSEKVAGPIGADERNSLESLQNTLEALLSRRIQEQNQVIVDFISKEKDFKKYNFKNVR